MYIRNSTSAVSDASRVLLQSTTQSLGVQWVDNFKTNTPHLSVDYQDYGILDKSTLFKLNMKCVKIISSSGHRHDRLLLLRLVVIWVRCGRDLFWIKDSKVRDWVRGRIHTLSINSTIFCQINDLWILRK